MKSHVFVTKDIITIGGNGQYCSAGCRGLKFAQSAVWCQYYDEWLEGEEEVYVRPQSCIEGQSEFEQLYTGVEEEIDDDSE
jgi:hypothetical protein